MTDVDSQRPGPRSRARGSLWMLLAALCFTGMGVLVKLALRRHGTLEVLFYRSLVAVLWFSPMLIVRGRDALATPHRRAHVERALAGLSSLALFYVAIGRMALGAATVLNYTSPLFMALLSALVLGDRLRPLAVAAVATGFAGVAVLVRPGFPQGGDLAPWAALASGFLAGVSALTVRRLGRLGEPAWRVVFYLALISALAAAAGIVATGGLRPLTVAGAALLAGVGVFDLGAQLAMTRAYREGDTLTVGSLSYLTVVFTSLAGIALWNELPSGLSWAAMGVIVVSGVVTGLASQ